MHRKEIAESRWVFNLAEKGVTRSRAWKLKPVKFKLVYAASIFNDNKIRTVLTT